MEFLVRFKTRLPPGLPDSEVAQLRTTERARAMELRASGTLQRLWRVPGRREVVGLWKAVDADELHDALASLPMFPYIDATVEPLATHPQENASSTATPAP